MKIRFLLFILLLFACQNTANKQNQGKELSLNENKQTENKQNNKSSDNIKCDKQVCVELRSHDPEKKSFDVYLVNSIPVAGFQSDFNDLNIDAANGGFLESNGYQTSFKGSRILSFSMQLKPIGVGEGILTTIFYTEPVEEICMSDIIFAGIAGEQLTNNNPSCID